MIEHAEGCAICHLGFAVQRCTSCAIVHAVAQNAGRVEPEIAIVLVTKLKDIGCMTSKGSSQDELTEPRIGNLTFRTRNDVLERAEVGVKAKRALV